MKSGGRPHNRNRALNLNPPAAHRAAVRRRFTTAKPIPPMVTRNGIPATATFAACQRAADRSQYCLLNSFPAGGTNKQPVARWSETGNYEAMFDCSDPKLALDARKANPCTSISADLKGDVWLGGRDGTAAVAAAVLGALADATSITYVYKLCAFLPAIGLLAVFLPNFKAHKK